MNLLAGGNKTWVALSDRRYGNPSSFTDSEGVFDEPWISFRILKIPPLKNFEFILNLTAYHKFIMTCTPVSFHVPIKKLSENCIFTLPLTK